MKKKTIKTEERSLNDIYYDMLWRLRRINAELTVMREDLERRTAKLREENDRLRNSPLVRFRIADDDCIDVVDYAVLNDQPPIYPIVPLLPGPQEGKAIQP
jgi:hypothetical protein